MKTNSEHISGEQLPDNKPAVRKWMAGKARQPSAESLTKDILDGHITALSRAITLIESMNPVHLEKAGLIINNCLPYAGRSVRIGITGVPGVGKSTFIESFGTYLTSIGKKVAVLAIDPSSSISGGSILGDKTRMGELVKNPRAYIRPTPAGQTLGGVSRKTRETMVLCEAAGFDVIIIETVGVGQSETAVFDMTDYFLLLQLSGAGDELQGIKRGIMEMADAVVINKADGDNVKRARAAKTDISRALHLFPAKESGVAPFVSTCSAVEGTGISEIWEAIVGYLGATGVNGYFDKKRARQNDYWMTATLNEMIMASFYHRPESETLIKSYQEMIARNEISPFAAAQKIFDTYLGSISGK